MRNHTIKGLALVAGAFLVAVALSASANAGTLRRGSTGGGATVTGSQPGQVLWTYYDTEEIYNGCHSTAPSGTEGKEGHCNFAGNGDNIIRLINPNGAANVQLSGAVEQTVCAMIYVFDDDEEMGECCGCPVSSAGLLTLSVYHNLHENWGVAGGPEDGSHSVGAIAIIAAAPNGAGACVPWASSSGLGYSITTSNNLLGSITHNQMVEEGWDHESTLGNTTSGLTEIGLFDNGGGDPTNNTYLQVECGALTGNGSLGAICTCPVE